MPRSADLRDPPPMTVQEATQAFGSALRVRLIRYYLDHPGAAQTDAGEALGVRAATLSENMKLLADLAVLVKEGRHYSADPVRVAELRTALTEYLASTSDD